MKRSLVLLLALFAFTMPIAGCKAISKLMPASTIDNPTDGTPEFLVYKAIEAGLAPDIEDGWAKLRPYLHSSLTAMRTTEDNFLNLNFAAFHRKVHLFTKGAKGTPEDDKPVYKLDYSDTDTGDEDKERRLFVVSEGSDMPAPFRIARDPAANNEWRVKNIP